MNVAINYITSPGGTYYAFPVSQSLADWATYRVLLPEGTGDNTGKYSAEVDSDNGRDWAIFAGGTQPSDWSEAIDIVQVARTVTISRVGKTAITYTETNS